MPALRPAWRGQLRLSLVTILVELFPAQTEPRTRFRQIHRPTMKPVRYEKVVAGIGPVPAGEILKGFEYEKGDYVLLSEDEIDAVKLETRKTMDLVQFVDLCEINPLYFDKAYYVQPADELAEDAYLVIRDALAHSGKVGVGQIAMRGHEYLGALQASKNGLLLNTLHYEEEVKRAEEAFRGIDPEPAPRPTVMLARQLIERDTRPFNPRLYKNNYEEALKALVKKKVAALPRKAKPATGMKPEEGAASATNVIDLMASLKRSLEGGAPVPATSGKANTRRAAGSGKTRQNSSARKAG